MMKQVSIDVGQKPTKEQIESIKAIKDEDIVLDKDCPELSPSMRKALRCAVAQRNRIKKIAN